MSQKSAAPPPSRPPRRWCATSAARRASTTPPRTRSASSSRACAARRASPPCAAARPSPRACTTPGQGVPRSRQAAPGRRHGACRHHRRGQGAPPGSPRLKEVVAEQALELRLLKKSMIAAGDDRDMRYPAAEKLEIIRLVEQSHLPARRTLRQLGIPPATFYRWVRPLPAWWPRSPGRSPVAARSRLEPHRRCSAGRSSTSPWPSPNCRRASWPCASPTSSATSSPKPRSIACSRRMT